MKRNTIEYDDPRYLELAEKFNKRTKRICTPTAINAVQNVANAMINDPDRYGTTGLYTVEIHEDGSLHKYDYFTKEYHSPLNQNPDD